MAHYHVNAFSDDGTGVAYADYVYRHREDAEDSLADSKMRSFRQETPFSPEDVEKEQVRECNDSSCIGDEG